MQPIKNRIIIKPDDAPEVSDGGIILTALEERPKNTGVVVGKGELVTDVEIGDRVIHTPMEAFDGGKFMLDGVMHFAMRDKDILAILVNEK